MNGKGQKPPKVLILSVVGNAKESNLSGDKRALRADQVSVEYRPSVGRVSAECRPSVDVECRPSVDVLY